MTQRAGAAATLERILQCTETECAEHGLAAGRIQDIATNAGVKKQLVHHYFDSKEEL